MSHRKNLGFLRFKQCRVAFAAGEFFDFELFKPFVFFESCLKPTDESNECAESEEMQAACPASEFE
jgi:hypothetical protein